MVKTTKNILGPKMPRTAYNFYLKENFSSTKSKLNKEKIKEIADLWKKLKDKQKYHEMAK